jgi:N utilization substance protein B
MDQADTSLAQTLYGLLDDTEPLVDPEVRAASDTEWVRHVLGEIATHRDAIDARLADHMDRVMASADPVERAILRLGAFELLYRPNTPYRVVVNEALELAKTYGATDSHRYINGVLDKIARTQRTPTSSES